MPGYACVWEFRVAPERAAAFEQAYGPAGDWVQLFRRSPGYLRSELHRDLRDPLRYLTVDYWESRAAAEAFRARFAPEYEALDTRCEALTRSETEIGRFEPLE
jgi:quinol monooxygenase YgiN